MYYDRYLGKLAGLVGKDDVENAQIDAVVDFFNDYNYSEELIVLYNISWQNMLIFFFRTCWANCLR